MFVCVYAIGSECMAYQHVPTMVHVYMGVYSMTVYMMYTYVCGCMFVCLYVCTDVHICMCVGISKCTQYGVLVAVYLGSVYIQYDCVYDVYICVWVYVCMPICMYRCTYMYVCGYK